MPLVDKANVVEKSNSGIYLIDDLVLPKRSGVYRELRSPLHKYSL